MDPAMPDGPSDPAGFAYPLYIVFLLAPTIYLPFHTVQILYRYIAVILSTLSVLLWMRVFGHRPSVVSTAVASPLLLGSCPVVQSLILQQPTLIVAALIAAASAAVAGGAYWAAQERKWLFLSFTASMAALYAGAEPLLPGWIWRWRQAVSDYTAYSLSLPAQVQLLFGKIGGIAIGAGICVAIAVFCWKARRDSARTDRDRSRRTVDRHSVQERSSGRSCHQ